MRQPTLTHKHTHIHHFYFHYAYLKCHSTEEHYVKKMLFQIPDLVWLNFTSPSEAGQGHSRKNREGNSCQGSMNALIPQECASEIYMTVMIPSMINPGCSKMYCDCFFRCLYHCLFVSEQPQPQTYQCIIFVFSWTTLL